GAGERVVGAEGPGRNAEVSHAGIVRQHDGQRYGRFAGASPLVEDVCDGVGGKGAAQVRLGEREVDLGGAVDVEQAEQATGRAAEMTAVQGDLLEECLRVGAGGHQPVSSAVLACAALVVFESVEMVPVFD